MGNSKHYHKYSESKQKMREVISIHVGQAGI